MLSPNFQSGGKDGTLKQQESLFSTVFFSLSPRYGGKTDADFLDRKTVNYSVGEANHVPIVQNYERRLIRNFHKFGLCHEIKISQKNIKKLVSLTNSDYFHLIHCNHHNYVLHSTRPLILGEQIIEDTLIRICSS